MKKHTHETARVMEFCACGAISTDGGEWVEGKDPCAAALVSKSIAMSTPEWRHQRATNAGRERWKGMTKKQRAEAMREVASLPRPNRRIEDRCECGRFSRALAEKRGHLCGKALEAALAKREKNGR